jgi:hypothetical protein
MDANLRLISLTLTNIASIDSEVNLLFSPSGENNSPFDTYYRAEIVFYSSNSFSVDYTSGGVPYSNYYYSMTSIDSMIALMNIDFDGLAVFTYEINDSVPYYYINIEILDSRIVFTSINLLLDTPIVYPFSAIEVISGSTVTVQTEGGITYNELLSELQTQPYIINPVNIYTNTQAQSLQRFRKTQKEATGYTLIEFERPKLDPMQNQFAIEGIQTKFTPSALNALNYNIKANQTVRIWLYYKMIDISQPSEIPPIKKVLPTKKVEKMIIKESINPFFDLMGITNVKKINIKEDIKKTINLRNDITDEEVYNCFDGLDYKNIKK